MPRPNRIPKDAYDRYLAMGEARSLRRLASELGCSVTGLAKRAKKEGWNDRVSELERTIEAGETAKRTLGYVPLTQIRDAVRARVLEALEGPEAMSADAAANIAARLLATAEQSRMRRQLAAEKTITAAQAREALAIVLREAARAIRAFDEDRAREWLRRLEQNEDLRRVLNAGVVEGKLVELNGSSREGA